MKNLFIVLTLFSYSILAQVGINNPLPDTSTVLDLSGPNNNGRGLLIPTTVDLINSVPNTTNGLLIKDSTLNEIYIRFELDNKWQAVNPWRQEYNTNNIYTIGKKVGIGIQNPTNAFEVLGNVSFSGNLAITNINATGTITATKFVGDGIVPRGAIMMWSGTTPPTGWVICDGRGYNLNGSVFVCPPGLACLGPHTKTPDLMGRFIVGYDSGSSDYINPGNISQSAPYSPQLLGTNQPGQTGGLETVKLNALQSALPSHSHSKGSLATSSNGAHSHTIPTTTGASAGANHLKRRSANSAGTMNTSTTGNHTHTITGSTGTTSISLAPQAHENRPPYYVLAYIMKL